MNCQSGSGESLEIVEKLGSLCAVCVAFVGSKVRLHLCDMGNRHTHLIRAGHNSISPFGVK